MGKWWCVADRLQPVTGFSRATHAWDRLSAGTPAHAVTAVTAVPRRDPATAYCSLGGPAVTAVIIGIRIPRVVTAVIIAPAVIAAGVTRRAFVTRPVGTWGAVIAVAVAVASPSASPWPP
jgi:hypothetical protein